jgi:NAD(P)-dependent dehydrogenase (short-subunit alcohol dehydrogenase family)
MEWAVSRASVQFCSRTIEGNTVKLQDKVAIVTGAATGIGQAIALAFAEAGAAVVVDYVGQASVSEDTLNKIAAMGKKSLGVDADISLPDDVNNLIQKTRTAFGKLDIFVNNAGIEKKAAFVDYPLDEWHKIMAVKSHRAFSLFPGRSQADDPAGQGRPDHQHLLNPRGSTNAYKRSLLRLQGRAANAHADDCSRTRAPSDYGE